MQGKLQESEFGLKKASMEAESDINKLNLILKIQQEKKAEAQQNRLFTQGQERNVIAEGELRFKKESNTPDTYRNILTKRFTADGDTDPDKIAEKLKVYEGMKFRVGEKDVKFLDFIGTPAQLGKMMTQATSDATKALNERLKKDIEKPNEMSEYAKKLNGLLPTSKAVQYAQNKAKKEGWIIRGEEISKGYQNIYDEKGTQYTVEKKEWEYWAYPENTADEVDREHNENKNKAINTQYQVQTGRAPQKNDWFKMSSGNIQIFDGKSWQEAVPDK